MKEINQCDANLFFWALIIHHSCVKSFHASCICPAFYFVQGLHVIEILAGRLKRKFVK